MKNNGAYRKKLIDVALPLEIINAASIREKSIRHGHPSTLHLWWSRKPLATCRAILFASLVDDPSEHFENEADQEKERKRLFGLMEKLIRWENSCDQEILASAHEEIRKSINDDKLLVRDPFCGGGSIPLEAQRLGLSTSSSDINPVAVLITKALVEIPPKFAGRLPTNPDAKLALMSHDWQGAQGLADDIRYYGMLVRDEAARRIGHLYPKAVLPKEYGGGEAVVIAWLWVRTVVCPNPACGSRMPLTNKWWLSKKKGKESWVEPHIDDSVDPSVIHFAVKTGKGQPQDGTVNRQGARCIACGTPVPFDHVRNEGKAGHMGVHLITIVAEGQRGRIYLPPIQDHIKAADMVGSTWKPDQELQGKCRVSVPLYGMNTFGDLFSPRQLVALTTFSDLVQEARDKVLHDARIAGWSVDGISLNDGGTGANAYADAVATYLAIAVDRLADRNSAICTWDITRDSTRNTFARQAIPMVWDYAEANPLSGSTGNFYGAVEWVAEVVEASSCEAQGNATLAVSGGHVFSLTGKVRQRDATETVNGNSNLLFSTDPPYYDNIGYADLSDFFYIWLHRTLKNVYPELLQDALTPKERELVATPYRFGGSKEKARAFFEETLGKVFEDMRKYQHSAYPLTLYYAFKQVESGYDANHHDNEYGDSTKTTISTGWETMLEALIQAGFTITGTWPISTEMVNRSVGQGANALTSSIVLVCRPRPDQAPIASRRQFLQALRAELPAALRALQHGGIAPVDFAQASIGPGMAIYSRYSKVVESDGTTLSVRTALQLINRALDEVLAEQEGEYDAETRWAVAWFEEYAMNAGEYGRAETLSKAKNTSVQSLVDAGFLEARSGKVRLLKRDELSEVWHPKEQRHLSVWEVMQRMIGALDKKGETAAGDILRQTGSQAEIARDLAYRLYTVCERKGWTQEALSYNSLVTSWSEISRLANREASDGKLWEATFLGKGKELI